LSLFTFIKDEEAYVKYQSNRSAGYTFDTDTQTCFMGTFHKYNDFHTLYRLYILYSNPTPKPTRLSAFLQKSKT